MADDPYRYFRPEAREITEKLGQGVLALEKGEPPEAHVPSLLRLAHTLKGAARVVKQPEIADRAHAIEDVLEPLRKNERTLNRAEIERLLELLDEITALVNGLSQRDEAPADAASDARRVSTVDEASRTVRAEVSDVDVVIDTLSEIGVLIGRLSAPLLDLEQCRKTAELLAGYLGSPRARGTRRGGDAAGKVMRLAEELRVTLGQLERRFTAAAEGMERELRLARSTAERLRLIPAGTLFPALERTVRDVARSTGRQADFHGNSGDMRLDADVLAAVQPALVQLVRNAVAHGIEPPAERKVRGKSPHGRVVVEVTQQDKRVIFRCEDDGGGVDVAAVRAVAARKGVLGGRSDSLDAQAILQLLFTGGLSTAGTVTQTSGRGVGLDLVREAIAILGGEISVRTEPGRGTTVDLIVPVSLTSLDALLVETAGVTAAIPVTAVRQAVRVHASDLAHTPRGPALLLDGVLVPLVPLARSLGLRREERNVDAFSAIVVDSGGRMAAIAVDNLLRTENVVMRPLPPTAPARVIVSGAAFDPHGTPQLVLDPKELIGAILSSDEAARPREVAARRLPVLVIDDSLTTRMLEQSILESAGYQVHLAASAEEGMEMARRSDYSLFLVDVEMPGMDGFTFVERTRADPALRNVPAILVTSRNAPEDRKRGEDAGASAYIVKSEFDQDQLLRIIGRLVA